MEIGKTRLALTASMLAMALALAGCGGGGSGSTTTAPPTGPGRDAGNDTPTSVMVSLASVNRTSDLYMAPEAGEFNLDAGDSMDKGSVTFTCPADADNGCMVTVADDGTVMATGGAMAANSSDYAMELAGAATAEQERQMAENMAIAEALTGARGIVPNVVAMVAGGKLPESEAKSEDGFKPSMQAPPAITDWDNKAFIKQSEDGKTLDVIVSYTDFKEPAPAAFKTYYGAGSATPEGNVLDDADNTAGDAYVDWAGVASAADVDHDSDVDTAMVRVLTLSTTEIAADDAERLFMATMFPGNGDTRTYPDGDDETDAIEVEFAGMFHGVEGMFACTGATCSAAKDAMGALTLVGAWTFLPDDDSGMVAGVMRDVDYLDFGFWYQTVEDKDGDITWMASAFADGARDYGDTSGLQGKATYNGAAAGLYAKKTFDTEGVGTPTASGGFTADASLTAYFSQITTGDDANSIAPNVLNTIGGEVSNFRNEDGDLIDSSWTLELTRGPANSVSSGAFTGTTEGSEGAAAGAWSAMSHGAVGTNGAQPSAVSGTFDGHFTNGHVLGAFGANMVEDKK